MKSDSFLDDLEPGLRARLTRLGKPVAKRRSELLYASGDEGRTVWLVEQGRVRLYVLAVEGRKLVTAFVGAGGLIGEAAIYGGPGHTTFAEAAADSRLIAVPAADFRRMMLDYPALTLRVTQELAERIRHAESSAESLVRQSASARMAALLLQLTRGQAGEVRGLAHQDLGDMIGVYRETATVILNQFRAAGMISLGILQLQVLAPTSLQAIAADPRRRARAN